MRFRFFTQATRLFSHGDYTARTNSLTEYGVHMKPYTSVNPTVSEYAHGLADTILNHAHPIRWLYLKPVLNSLQQLDSALYTHTLQTLSQEIHEDYPQHAPEFQSIVGIALPKPETTPIPTNR
ncbi:MAG: hypothetical protein A3J38_01160 [Gammaproteobacteria bacterium RIFCSPHIGHO2_12_FULL_45_9]|nr:MAG: hypothetical protein A3J38_01160 [Gammaproteobacteria bacterium RIFCSPHIGHO2_12_FULL_45_9]